MKRLLATIASLLCLGSVAHAQSSLQILDYGAEPRTPLRYKFAVGKTERMTMEMTMNMATEVNGKLTPATTMPPTRTTMLLRVAEVAADGTARLEFETQSTESPVGQVVGQANQAVLDRTLAGLSMLKGWYRTDTRGSVLDMGMTLPEGMVPDMAKPIMDEMMNEASDALQQLPDEALGIGARWQVMQKLDIAGVKISQGQEYTLRSRNGSRVELATRIVQPPDAASTTLAPGITMQSVTTGSGTTVIDLNGISPTMTMEVNTTATMSSASPNQTVPTKMVMQMKMTSGPALY